MTIKKEGEIMDEDGYFLIKDQNLVGKIDDNVSYIYNKHIQKWVIDESRIIMERLLGYDGESIGNTSMLEKIEEISKEEAEKFINNLN